jgi:peroxiredoxin (alkyl hydroperoxide reductase subunit C)
MTGSVLVGRNAPTFSSAAVLASGEIVPQYTFPVAGKYTVVFFYPLDFTFVCPTELIALNDRIAKFHALNVEVVGVSIDSQFTHFAWRNTSVQEGGIGPLQFPLVADVTHEICRSYGVEHDDAGVALRGAFLIDKNGVVRHQVVNDLPLGRNIDELLRTISALQHFEEFGEVCPAGWQKGKASIKASPEGIAEYLRTHEKELRAEESA